MTLHGKNIIGGEPLASGTTAFQATAAATGEKLAPPFLAATQVEVDKALAAAEQAFTELRHQPPERFAALLERLAEEIMALGKELLERGMAETGLPEARLVGERARTCNQLKMFAALVREGSWVEAVIDTAEPDRQPLPKPDLRRMARPLGPVVVFGAGNFPFAFGACGGDTASALAAGNPVVVKAHRGHPGVNELCGHAAVAAVKACGLPAGTFGLLQGPGSTVGQALVKHPFTRAVGFTGSKRAGRLLFDLAAARPVPIPVYAEMGSLNPLVILPGALAERSEQLASGLAQSITLGVGQFCTKPGLVLLLECARAEAFVQQLAKALAALPAGTMLDRELQASFCEATGKFAQVSGVRALVTGPAATGTQAAPSLYEVAATTWLREPALHEEAFGPAALLVRCRGLDELKRVLAAAGGHLTGTLHCGASDDPDSLSELTALLEAHVGRVLFGGFPTGVEVCPAMVHGGPYPATSAPLTTSVGTLAIRRFARPVCYQNVPERFLPPELHNENVRNLWRLVNGRMTQDSL